MRGFKSTILILLIINASIYQLQAENTSRILEGQRSQPLEDRINAQSVDQEITGSEPVNTIEKSAFVLNTNEEGETEGTILLNPYILTGLKQNTFDGYRKIPWWLRNMELGVTAPLSQTKLQEGSLEFKLNLTRKSHKWNEHWDALFPSLPQRRGDLTPEKREQIIKRAETVNDSIDTVLKNKSVNGLSLVFSYGKDQHKTSWSAGLAGSHKIWSLLFSLDAKAAKTADSTDAGGESNFQIGGEIFPNLMKAGGVDLSMTWSSGQVVKIDQVENWSAKFSLSFPIIMQGKAVIAYVLDDNDRRMMFGISTQMMNN